MGGIVGLKPNHRRGKAGGKPWRKRRIQQSMQELRKHISILEWKKLGEIKRKEEYEVIEHKYRVKKEGLNVVLQELKQKIQAKTTKLKRYDQWIEYYGINRLLQLVQKRVTNSWMEKLKAAKSLTQKKLGDFGATFGEQERRVTIKMLNG